MPFIGSDLANPPLFPIGVPTVRDMGQVSLSWQKISPSLTSYHISTITSECKNIYTCMHTSMNEKMPLMFLVSHFSISLYFTISSKEFSIVLQLPAILAVFSWPCWTLWQGKEGFKAQLPCFLNRFIYFKVYMAEFSHVKCVAHQNVI